MTDKQIPNERRQYEYKSVFNTSDDNDKTMENLYKQIIIDDIDVSGCTHHYNGWSNLHRDTRTMCEFGYDRECKPKDFECSYYVKYLEKQLKAKEQECEELKGKNNYSPKVLKQCPHYKNDNVCTYLGYETKCEGDCNYTAFQDFIAEIDELKEKIKAYDEVYSNHDVLNERNKFKTALTEIKDITEPWYTLGSKDSPVAQILQKISEVIPNEN